MRFLDCPDICRRARCHLVDDQSHTGATLATAIIVCDVVVNAWVGMRYGFDIASFFAQVLFLVFVISTVGIAWRFDSRKLLRQQARA
jgi:hypothetical protein